MLRLIRTGIAVGAQLNGPESTGRSPCLSLFLDQPAVSIEPEVYVVPISIVRAKAGHPGMPPACPVRRVSQLDPVGEPRLTPTFRIVSAPDEIVARSSIHVLCPGGEDHIVRRDIAIGEPPSEELVLDGLPAATDAEREVARWRALFGSESKPPLVVLGSAGVPPTRAVDTIEKKTRALRSIGARLNLKNLDVWNGRSEEWSGRCDYSVSRATGSLSNLWSWHVRSSNPPDSGDSEVWKKGLLCLKGGDLKDEIQELERGFQEVEIDVCEIARLLDHAYFVSKSLIHVHI